MKHFSLTTLAHDCDVLRRHGIITTKCRAHYVVYEGREPLIIDNDDDIGISEIKRSPLHSRQQLSETVGSTTGGCQTDDSNGNWLVNLLSNVYRNLVICDSLKVKKVRIKQA